MLGLIGAFILGVFIGLFFGGWVSAALAACDYERKLDQAVQESNRLRRSLRLEIFVTTDYGRAWGAFIQSVPGEKVFSALKSVSVGARSFSQRDMCGAGAPLTRDEFDRLRAELVDRGFLYWKNPECPNLGVEWTPAGKALLRDVGRVSLPTPLPHNERADVSSGHALTHAHSLTAAHYVFARDSEV